MGDWLTLHVASLVLIAAAFGGMSFFMALFAPAVFRFLPREDAAVFMRSLFPTYFLAMGFVSLIPALILSQGVKDPAKFEEAMVKLVKQLDGVVKNAGGQGKAAEQKL